MARNAIRRSAWIGVALAALLLACGGEQETAAGAAEESAAARESATGGELWPSGDASEPGGTAPVPDRGASPAAAASDPPDPPDPDELHAARAEVERLGVVVSQAESDLEAANAALSVARERLAELRAATPRWPDSQIFRNVQRRLLTDPALSHVAIAAEVTAGTVTLRGVVPNERTLRAATRIAESVEGVLAVENRLTLAE